MTTGPLRAVSAVFVLNGILFATLVSRIPDVRSSLRLSDGDLGLLLLSAAGGSLVALPTTGRLVERAGAGVGVLIGAVAEAVGLVVAALGAGALTTVPLTAAGLAVYGAGVGVWDVAMNAEGAAVEQRLGRTVMPRFHAGWSIGSILGSGVGVVMAALGVPLALHLSVAAVVVLLAAARAARGFLPRAAELHETAVERPGSAWCEPRTLVIGLMVLTYAMVEGTANDWLSLGLVDGYHVAHWVGVAGFSVFVVSMTTGRLLGTRVLDRLGRAPVLRAAAVAAAIGTLLTVFGGVLPVVVLGLVVWGLGASLGFPVGMSAAADDPSRAAARLSVASTIGYGAFLAGPPLLGRLADHVGTLHSLLVVAAVMVPAVFLVGATRSSVPVVGGRA